MRCCWAVSIPALRVFVYGTLKSGESNHAHYCEGALKVEASTTRGKLYNLPYGFPGLCVPEDAIIAAGTTDYLADADLQSSTVAKSDAPAAMDVVHGEVLTFEDALTRLPAFDALEGYTPGANSLYRRVLYPVEVGGANILAWLYHIPRPAGEYLPGGRWPAPLS